MNIIIKYPPAPHVTYEIRRYGDPFMVAMMGLDTEYLGTGNFQNVVLATWKNNVLTFGAVSQFQALSDADCKYLASIQTPDAKTVAQKLNWLGIDNPKGGRPYPSATDDAGNVIENRYGTMVWGGTRVQLEIDPLTGKPREWTFTGRYQQEDKSKPMHPITFVKPVFFRRADMGRPLAELIAECKVVRATEAYASPPAPLPNTFNDTPQGGIIWSPLWSPEDWTVNNGQNALYLAKEFLLWQ